ncbi:MAG: hypothetical protein SAJ12_05330 [Jaaginema sp. PMC 1079.18]|nr:hypothetical protein [Jaaginema sp. PMC 1080.18]MEC4850413.1 hypothetical protein [Jaaginema sp. PMC 1079.18]MEC4864749.1 hypothetical protein [Jaaginema sp. PMC 1078.18]
MADIRKLIAQLANAEANLHTTEFLAPCVRGGKVRAKMASLVYTFEPNPCDFEGWGIFQARSDRVAELVDEPLLPQIDAYLQCLPLLRLRLLYPLQHHTWLAYPSNQGDMQQRFGFARPLPVHLVSEGDKFETIVARVDSNICWFEALDRRAEAWVGDRLQDALQQELTPDAVQFSGLTPEMRIAYDLVWQKTAAAQQQKEENRLRNALKQGGGELRSSRDRGDYWQVEWRTADGELHTSAIAKNDLTVMSSGICLSGRDRDFDLQSLVGVMENRE